MLYFLLMLEKTMEKAGGIANHASEMGSGMAQQGLNIGVDALAAIMPFIWAILLVVIGGYIIKKVMKCVSGGLEKAGIDKGLEKIGLTGQLKDLGINISASKLISGIISLIANFVLWMAAISIVNITALSDLMAKIVDFIPNMLVALILVFAGLTISKIVSDIVAKSAKSLSVSEDTAKTMAKGVKIAILIFTGMAVMSQLHIAEALIQTLFTGIVTIVTLAGGIAFGLGGQDKAKEIINNISKK